LVPVVLVWGSIVVLLLLLVARGLLVNDRWLVCFTEPGSLLDN
jgi:hypothetical protein